MTRENAAALMAIYARVGDAFNEATTIIAGEADSEEQKRLRKPLGALMIDLYTQLQLPIIRAFPELDPDRRDEAAG